MGRKVRLVEKTGGKTEDWKKLKRRDHDSMFVFIRLSWTQEQDITPEIVSVVDETVTDSKHVPVL